MVLTKTYELQSSNEWVGNGFVENELVWFWSYLNSIASSGNFQKGQLHTQQSTYLLKWGNKQHLDSRLEEMLRWHSSTPQKHPLINQRLMIRLHCLISSFFPGIYEFENRFSKQCSIRVNKRNSCMYWESRAVARSENPGGM